MKMVANETLQQSTDEDNKSSQNFELSKFQIIRKVIKSLSIKNESNLICGDNVGGEVEAATSDSASRNPFSYFNDESSTEASYSSKDAISESSLPLCPSLERVQKRRTNKSHNITELPREGYVRMWQILQVIPVCKSTWWQGVRDGRFPQAIKLGPRTTVWLVSDIRKLIESLGGRHG